MSEKTNHLLLNLILSFSLFSIIFLVYELIYLEPRTWYDHYLHLAKALLDGRVNLINIPQFYQDVIIRGNNIYVPFPIGPSLVLIPFILIWPEITQQQVAVFIGALNAAIFYFLAIKFTDRVKAYLLSLFLSLGTALFWASVVGTTWYYAHVVAFMFILLSLISHFEKRDILAGILFSLAVLCRYPLLLGVIFFLLQLKGDNKRLVKFLIAAAALAPLHFLYSYARFGNIFETGYVEVYQGYLNMNYPYTILQLINPQTPLFGYLDIRNIPLHLFTFLIQPPIITNSLKITPSPYGLGIIFTSPLLFLALKPNFKNKLEANLFLGSVSIAFIDFLHYMQGWVQFGYRFVLDFLPFLLIILCLRFKLTKLTILLIIISILVNFWGVGQAIVLGW